MRSEESKQNIKLIRVIKMSSKVYKWCAVPLCKNTSIRTSNKLFVHVPNKKIIRDKWLKLARRNPNDVVTNSRLYFCEDHFDLPNDMENYMEYHVMGSVLQVRMKPGCMPHKFICQPDRKPGTSDTTERPYIAKKRKKCKKKFEEKFIVTEQSCFEEIASGSSVPSLNQPLGTEIFEEHSYARTQRKIKETVNQATQTKITLRNSQTQTTTKDIF